MYTPSFVELTGLLIVVALWSRWLEPRKPAARYLMGLTVAAVGGSLAAAIIAIQLQNLEWVDTSRSLGLGACLVSLALLLSWTLLTWGREPVNDP